MSSLQIRNFRLFRSLFRQIKGYGLNPLDWKLDPVANDGTVQMRHRDDEDFRFKGNVQRTATGEFFLTNLCLASL